MRKMELLAPAGNMESLKAAVLARCDAVYLGGYIFGARSYAGNFSNEEIIEAIKYAHLYGVKIYVTVNTLIYEDEVETFINYIDFLHQNNVDAVIVQDIGMMDLIRGLYPNLEVHASTQMHIHNIDGVKLLKRLGVKRAVIARETSAQVIRQIKKEVSMELEVFVHGALCVSYSGQCLMSSLIGGRSGNRGTCAQSCRQNYSLEIDNEIVKENEYLLSMKDLNTLEYVGELIEIGVDSLKIEGRMKRPEYVYLVVSLYRKAIDSYLKAGKINISDEDIVELKKMFNREFTKGFLFNEENNQITNSFRPNHIGIDIGKVIKKKGNKIYIQLSDKLSLNDGIRIIGKKEDIGFTISKLIVNNKIVKEAYKNDIVELMVKEDIDLTSKVVKTTDINQLNVIAGKIKDNDRKISIDAKIKIVLNKKIELEISDKKHLIKVVSDDTVTKAEKHVISKEQIENQLKRLGDTIYKINDLSINLDNNVFVSLRVLNELRRSAINLLNEKRQYQILYQKGLYKRKVNDYQKERNYNILISNLNQYEIIKDKPFRYIYVDNKDLYEKLKIDARLIFRHQRVINSYSDYDRITMIGELGGLNYYDKCHTDFSLNVTNSYAIAFLHSMGADKVTLSYELNENQIKDIINNYLKRYQAKPNLEVIVYGKEEVMISKYNLLNNYKTKQGVLKDRFNNNYTIKNIDDLMIIYNYKKRNLLETDYFNLGINNIRFNILEDSEVNEIINNIS